MHGSTDCAAQSMDCADPQIAPNTYSKQPIFGLTQEWLRESLSRLDLSSFGPALFEIWWHDIYLGGPYGPVKDEMNWSGGLKSAPGQRASAYVEGCILN